jgi:hypothetical protein
MKPFALANAVLWAAAILAAAGAGAPALLTLLLLPALAAVAVLLTHRGRRHDAT